MQDLQSTIIHTTLCILAILLSLPVASVALPIWLLFVLFQWAAATWILFWKMGQILSTKDVPFAQESNSRNFITCLFTVNGTLSVRVLRKAFCNKIFQGTDESYLRLKKCLRCKMGQYIRRDEENFDIRRHIFVYKGQPPCNDKELAKCFSELINQKIPNHISPWQLIIIPRGRKFGAKSFAICVRIHHTIGDGFALVGLFAKVVDNKPILVTPRVNRTVVISSTRRILRAIFTGPLVLFSIIFSSIENPFQRRKDLTGQIKVAWTKPIDLADIKRCKNQFGATVNDVLTGCLAGAMRRYLTSTGVKAPSDLQIAVTINNRTVSSVSEGQIPLGNDSTGVFFSLPVAVPTLAERIKTTKRRMDMVKNSTEYLVFGFLFKYVIATVPSFMARISNYAFNRSCCMVMSNVPGPLNQLQLVGNAVESAMVWPPLVSETGISVAIFSYAGKIRVSVKVDTAVISDPMILMDYFTKEVEDLVTMTSMDEASS